MIGFREGAAVEGPSASDGSRDPGAAEKLAEERVEFIANTATEVPRVAAGVERGDMHMASARDHGAQPARDLGIFEVGWIVAVTLADEVSKAEGDVEGAFAPSREGVAAIGDGIKDLLWEVIVIRREGEEIA